MGIIYTCGNNPFLFLMTGAVLDISVRQTLYALYRSNHSSLGM